MKKIVGIFTVVFMISIFAIGNAYANDAVPIMAEQAFDAYANKENPVTGNPANVAILDVRATAEYYWVGTCAQVDKIITKNGDEIIPYNGKMKLSGKTGLLRFKVWKHGLIVPRLIHVSKVEEIESTPIAINIPYMTWDDETCQKVLNDNFVYDVEALADEDIEVIIMMCRSGKRSTTAEFDFSLFTAVYEIDQPDGKNGRGGFQGTSYDDTYNGYRGFPGRKIFYQEHRSVSWSDAGLPVHIGWCPEE